MGILIADSGSTKADWALLNEKGEILGQWKTMGFNPYFHTANCIAEELKRQAWISKALDVEHVYFYGAGCSSLELNTIIQKGLQSVFKKAEVLVEHDVLGAAYATYTGEPAITCILGTGSNSAFFDGSKVSEEVPSLAYVVGDESSGSYYGKKLVKAYFYKKLDPQLRKAFEEEYQLEKNAFIHRVYNEAHANVYLASFMKFLGKYPQHPQVQTWVNEGMREFVDIHIKCFPQYKSVPVHFIGSVAYYFKHILEPILEEENIALGQIIKQPIDGLVNYHTKYILA